MTAHSLEPPPTACTLAARDFERRVAWIADLNRDVLLAHRRDNLRLELTYAPEAREQVHEMVLREQECCAFLTFDVREEPGAVRVIIEAPEAAREAVETLFEPFWAKTPT